MSARSDIQFTFLACADLKGIWQAIAMPTIPWGAAVPDNLAAAQSFAQEFAQHCELLGRSPELGLQRDELQHGIRSSAFQKYVIFYRMRGHCVEVVRVLRAARDIVAAA